MTVAFHFIIVYYNSIIKNAYGVLYWDIACHSVPENVQYSFNIRLELLPFISFQQLPDEFLGKLTGVAEELVIKLIIYGWNVSKCVLFGLSKEGWSTTQSK